MSDTVSGLVTIAVLVAALALVHVRLGNCLAAVFSSNRHLRVERNIYRLSGVDPLADQKPLPYTLSVLGFSGASLIVVYGLLRCQHVLPGSRGLAGMPPVQAFNTAVSFVTNTNWQSYAGESALGYLVQMAGLAVQNFVTAAVGLAVAIALVRGLIRVWTGRLGNFWVDLVRGTIRVLLPLASVAAIVLMAHGVIQNFTDTPIHAQAGTVQTITVARSRRRRRSKNSARMAAVTSTPTPPTRMRILMRSPTCSRSSCCC